MKYSHIIYNSSEQNREGGAGFGVRSATEGVTSEVLSQLEQNEVFSFTETGPEEISSAALSENPDEILKIIPEDFFRRINMPDRRSLYALGKKTAVGFDYTFYLSGEGGRTGNYVVDCYIFDDVPTAEEFEILLEEAAPKSNHFIPEDPTPHQDNEEMKAISIGHQPDLPVEECSFAALQRPDITSDVISLLFAFITSMKEGKPLLVKTDPVSPPAQMAALAYILPPEQIKNLSFLTNHSEEGKKQGINIVFINEYYQYEIFPKQWVMLDLTSGLPFESEESRVFRPMIEEFAHKSDIQNIRNLAGWCLSDLYDTSKKLSKNTQTALFNYLYNNSAFEIEMLASNQELLTALADYLAKHPEKKAPLLKALEERFNNIKTISDLYEWITFILRISPIDVSETIAPHKENITKNIFSTPQEFVKFFKHFRQDWKKVSKTFLNEDAFPAHREYLSALEPGGWEMLYPVFLAEKKDDRKYLLRVMLRDRLPADTFKRIVASQISDKQEYALYLAEILKETPGENESRIIELIKEVSPTLIKYPCDYFIAFKDKMDSAVYAPLFILDLEKTPLNSSQDVKNLHNKLTQFFINPASSEWLDSQKGKTVLTAAYNAIKKNVADKTISRDEAEDLTCSFFNKELPPENVRRFHILYDALKRKEESDYATTADLWAIAKEWGDMGYLCNLAPFQISSILKRNPESLHDLIGEYIEQGFISEDEALKMAESNPKGKKHILKGVIRYRKGKPNDILAYLTDTLGYSEEDAMAYLEEMFPNTHKKILKSRQPSLMDKIKGFFGSLFGGKDKEEAATPSDRTGVDSDSKAEEKSSKTKEKKKKKKGKR